MTHLLPHQQTAIARALAAPASRWLFADGTGCGKTAEGVGWAQALDAERLLVVAPAMARRTWLRELPRWWAARFGDGQDICMLDMSPGRKSQSKKRAATWDAQLTRSVRIVSPELFDATREGAFLTAPGRVACLVDEVHMLCNPATLRARKLDATLRAFKGPIAGLSATPVPNSIIGIANVVNIIWHRRLGRVQHGKVDYQFLKRYLVEERNQYGSKWAGLNPEHGAELWARLGWMMSRTTRDQLKGQIPDCQVIPLPVDPGTAAVDVVDGWLPGALAESTHQAILTHFKATAAALAAHLEAQGHFVVHVDGETPPTARGQAIDRLREAPKGILVATMHAVSESISLSWCHRSLLAELYWSPKVLIQVIGRFPRLDGTAETVLHIACGANTVQEKMAFSVANKLWEINQVVAAGAPEQSLTSALSNNTSMEAMLAEAAFSVASEADMELLCSMGEE